MSTYTERFEAALAPASLLGDFHGGRVTEIAKRLGAAAKAEGLSSLPHKVPGFAEALGGLAESDPLTVKIYAAYAEGYAA